MRPPFRPLLAILAAIALVQGAQAADHSWYYANDGIHQTWAATERTDERVTTIYRSQGGGRDVTRWESRPAYDQPVVVRHRPPVVVVPPPSAPVVVSTPSLPYGHPPVVVNPPVIGHPTVVMTPPPAYQHPVVVAQPAPHHPPVVVVPQPVYQTPCQPMVVVPPPPVIYAEPRPCHYPVRWGPTLSIGARVGRHMYINLSL